MSEIHTSNLIAVPTQALEITLKVAVGEYNGICLPSCSEASTGLQWEPQAMPECVNLTNTEWVDAYRSAPMPGGPPGVRVFVFKGVSPNPQPVEMLFLLKRHGQDFEPTQKAICTITVTQK